MSQPEPTRIWNGQILTSTEIRGKPAPTYQSRGFHFSRKIHLNFHSLEHEGASENVALKQTSSVEIAMNLFLFCSGSNCHWHTGWIFKISNILPSVYYSPSLSVCLWLDCSVFFCSRTDRCFIWVEYLTEGFIQNRCFVKFCWMMEQHMYSFLAKPWKIKWFHLLLAWEVYFFVPMFNAPKHFTYSNLLPFLSLFIYNLLI